MMPTPKIIVVSDDKTLRASCARMRFGASRELLTSNPVYAKDLRELEERFAKDYGPNAQSILDDPRGGILLFPGPVLASCVSSIDAFEDPKVWHLSLSRVIGPPAPGRLSDDVTRRICKAFFKGSYTEGPPEGVFKSVRHFRAPWTPD